MKHTIAIRLVQDQLELKRETIRRFNTNENLSKELQDKVDELTEEVNQLENTLRVLREDEKTENLLECHYE